MLPYSFSVATGDGTRDLSFVRTFLGRKASFRGLLFRMIRVRTVVVHIFAFTEAAALRCACAPTATRSSLPSESFFVFTSSFPSFLFLWRCRFFRDFCTITVFSLNGEYVVYIFYFRMVFFYWIFDIGLLLCENSINRV